MLFPGTIVACGAIAVMNVLLSPVIKRRAPDRAGLLIGIYLTSPATAASQSSLAQSVGYLVSAAGPLAVGFLRAATGGWTVPVTVLLLISGAEPAVGLFAGRPKVLAAPHPRVAAPASLGGAPRADKSPKLLICATARGVSP